MPGPRAVQIELSDEERTVLEGWVRRPKTAQALATRSRIVLACAAGGTNGQVAERVGVSLATGGKGGDRSAADGVRREGPRGDHQDSGGEAARRRHPLVVAVDGQGQWAVAVDGVADV